MAIVIDQFEIVKDDAETETAQVGKPAAQPPVAPALSTRDITDAWEHSRRRALRVRAS